MSCCGTWLNNASLRELQLGAERGQIVIGQRLVDDLRIGLHRVAAAVRPFEQEYHCRSGRSPCFRKRRRKIAAAAFIVGQTQYVQALYEAKVFSGLKPYTVDEMRKRQIQTTIKAIESETGLDFSAVRPFDAQGTLESTRQTSGSTI